MSRWKPVLGLALFVAAVIGGVMLYIRYQVTTSLDDLITEIRPVAELRYASVSVTPGGTIRIQGVEISPRAVSDPVRIEGIEVETPGLWFLLTGSRKLRDGQLPEYLRVTVRGLAFSLDGPMAETFDRFMAAVAQSSRVPPVSNCGDVRYFDFNAYQRLGYPSLVSDVTLGYRFEKDGGPLRITTEWRIRDVGVTTINLEFAGASSNLTPVTATRARLRAVDAVYKDLSFIDRLKRYCTRASGMSVEQYIESELNRSAAAYRELGVVPGPGLRQAHREFLTKPGEVRLEITPSVELDMQTLQLFKPEDLLSMLNLRVSVNGKAVTDLSMMTVASTPTRPALFPPTAAPRSVASEFRAVPTTDLAQHIGRTVRLHLAQGAPREGRLLQVLDGMARVERRLPGGTLTLAIPLRQIERAEVLL